jgi:cbb3-type cytochrome oxidase maturation protein
MNSLYILVPLSIAIVALACWFLFHAIDTGQMDNLDEIGRRMPDDEP